MPHSETEMLALTKSEAYVICAMKDESTGKCVDYCSEEKYYLDTEGNKCGSSECPSDKIMFVPSGVCIQSCDLDYYVTRNNTCGLCKYFYPDDYPYTLMGSNECLNEISLSNTMEVYNLKLKIYKCINGYKASGNKCVVDKECPENCLECTNTACTKCNTSYFLNDGVCQEHCSKGKSPNSDNECEDCNKKKCSNFEIDSCDCTECIESTFLKNKNCYDCDSSCKTCEGEATKCTSCQPGNQFLENNKCYDCGDGNCETKEANCKCKSCKSGFFLNSNYKCESCISDCTTCKDSKTCDKCKDDFYINTEGKCAKCPDSCATKKPGSCQCATCKEGYFMNADEECQECISPCNSCEKSANNCTSCIDGYFMNEIRECAQCDYSKCKTCSLNKEHCESCNDGLYLVKENNTCQNCDEHCETCSSGEEDGNYNCLSCKNDTDSIYVSDNDNKELENISDKQDFTSCRKCNMFRPRRAHHCQYCNKCILEMDHHCFTINKCIGKSNYKLFIKYLIFMEINTTCLSGITLYVCYNFHSELSLYDLIKYVLLTIASFLGSITLYFYLIFQAYLSLSNLTTLEFIYPKLRLTAKNLHQ